MKVISIGRSKNNDIVIDDATVSKHHALITVDDSRGIKIKDMESMNGTYVNGKRIDKESFISVNDVIKVGNKNVNWRQFLHVRTTEKPQIFGTTIRETIDAFKSASSSEKAQKISVRERNIILFRTAASLVLAGVAIYFFTHEKQDVSFGLGGSILGYWLK
jgi:pSer/pThr/pTyr-binding forkhead associated (FHA) protein